MENKSIISFVIHFHLKKIYYTFCSSISGRVLDLIYYGISRSFISPAKRIWGGQLLYEHYNLKYHKQFKSRNPSDTRCLRSYFHFLFFIFSLLNKKSSRRQTC